MYIIKVLVPKLIKITVIENDFTYGQGRILNFWGPDANEIMWPLLRQNHPLKLNIFTCDIFK